MGLRAWLFRCIQVGILSHFALDFGSLSFVMEKSHSIAEVLSLDATLSASKNRGIGMVGTGGGFAERF